MPSPRALVDFVEEEGRPPLRLAFTRCREVLQADRPARVRGVLDAVQQRAAAGAWCVGYVRYEAASAFDPAFAVHPADGPLAWFGVFEAGEDWPPPPAEGRQPPQWREDLDRARFDARIAHIHEAIRRGESYQINLTARLRSPAGGSAEAWFRALHRAQPASYAAFIDTGEAQVLSVSPELFFDWRDGRILLRPMKGTAARGATPAEDAAQAGRLAAAEKERAENLMIVDLVRNDVSRIARPFSVRVPRLFETQAWPTVWQMTSDVEARTREGCTLADVFGALFPCGSVTGVPKVRATEIIRTLEDGPRGVYCGAVGMVRPGGGATFNVPIRTVEIRGGEAVCGIGSGITIDAQAEDEWREWRSKRGFLGLAEERFVLLETLRLDSGAFFQREGHVQRLLASARYFGFAADEGAVRQALDALAAAHPRAAWRVRLLLAHDGGLQTQAFALPATPAPVVVRLAEAPMERVHPDFLRHKTTRRAHYERFAPADPAVFDTLLWNVDGDVTEFTRGNVLARLDGRWITPPLSAGVLPGVARAALLAEGAVQEAPLRKDDLPHVQALEFVNSLRGRLPALLKD